MSITVEAVRIKNGVFKGHLTRYDILSDGKVIGEVRSRRPKAGFVVQLHGVYWHANDVPSRIGGAVVRHRKTLKEVPAFIEKALSALEEGNKS